MNNRCLSAILAAIFLAAGLPSVANATLADDSTAIIADSVSISRTTYPEFSAHIDYAVYSPGEYPGSLTFPAGKYVYCYQLFNDPISTGIVSLNIDLLDTASIAYNPYYDTDSGSGAPGGSILPGTRVPFVDSSRIFYNFSRNAIPVNQHSAVLLFTSDFAPALTIDAGTVIDMEGDSFTMQLPTPLPTLIPEPASLFLLALVAPALLKTRKHKS
jgi:hypothetical protein